ncbi:MAG: SPOR domain-containing protein [Saprospiraceae bacterium]|nr:SPOR domain-containing protein [Saprospiraceae bacterium]
MFTSIIQKVRLVILLTVVVNLTAYAQAPGKVVFEEQASVSRAFENFVAKNRAEPTIRGWRIQIISTDDRREMENIRGRFAALYPGVPSAWKHVSPYYHIRVGAYRTKNEMMQFLTEIKKEFPAAIPVQDDIQKYDLIPY